MEEKWVVVGLILDRAELGGQGWGRGGGGGGGRGTAGTSSSRREFLRAIWNVFLLDWKRISLRVFHSTGKEK